MARAGAVGVGFSDGGDQVVVGVLGERGRVPAAGALGAAVVVGQGVADGFALGAKDGVALLDAGEHGGAARLAGAFPPAGGPDSHVDRPAVAAGHFFSVVPGQLRLRALLAGGGGGGPPASGAG